MSHHRDHPNGAIEQIHLPGASLVPLFTAIGITIGLVGLIFSWPFVAVGGLITFISVVIWIRNVRNEIEQLPTEHR